MQVFIMTTGWNERWNERWNKWNEKGPGSAPLARLFTLVYKSAVPPVPLFRGLVPPIDTPGTLVFTGFSPSSGTSGTSGTTNIEKCQIRRYSIVYSSMYSLI